MTSSRIFCAMPEIKSFDTGHYDALAVVRAAGKCR